MLNLDFDFMPYLDELHARGFNLTRTFSGTYREVPGSFKIANNTLAPRPGRYRLARRHPGQRRRNKFDLDRWDDAYFRRLKDVRRRRRRPRDRRRVRPVLPVLRGDPLGRQPDERREQRQRRRRDARATRSTRSSTPSCSGVSSAFVRKAVTELNGFDNLYFEICNEPYFGGVTLDWQRGSPTGSSRPRSTSRNKHLIAQNIANGKAKIDGPEPGRLDLQLPLRHAARRRRDELAAWNRPIGDDETGFRGTADRPYRSEAWEFLLAGGRGLQQPRLLVHRRPPRRHRRGQGPHPRRRRPALAQATGDPQAVPRGRSTSCKMKPDNAVVKASRTAPRPTSWPSRAAVRHLPARSPGQKLGLRLPAGTYRGEWIDTHTGDSRGGFLLERSESGTHEVESPKFDEDIALRIRAQ